MSTTWLNSGCLWLVPRVIYKHASPYCDQNNIVLSLDTGWACGQVSHNHHSDLQHVSLIWGDTRFKFACSSVTSLAAAFMPAMISKALVNVSSFFDCRQFYIAFVLNPQMYWSWRASSRNFFFFFSNSQSLQLCDEFNSPGAWFHWYHSMMIDFSSKYSNNVFIKRISFQFGRWQEVSKEIITCSPMTLSSTATSRSSDTLVNTFTCSTYAMIESSELTAAVALLQLSLFVNWNPSLITKKSCEPSDLNVYCYTMVLCGRYLGRNIKVVYVLMIQWW